MPASDIFRRLRLDWPLLGKELMEQAAQKRMYVMRVAYALLLFGAFCFYYARYVRYYGGMMALGKGLGPFMFLIMAQSAAIFLFLPPLMAGAIAQEKERDTLGLLFLTDLTPWELILQKYVGRLIPMLTLQFLSLPLLAVAYSLGGVSVGMLCISAATLFLTCLAVGALALECSAHEATTFQAVVRCWGLCLAFAICWWAGLSRFWLTMAPFNPAPFRAVFVLRIYYTVAAYLVPTFLFLLRAKQNLEPRAFVQRRDPFGHQFRQIDQYWKDLRKLTRAILRKRDPEAVALANEVVRKELGVAVDQRVWSLGGFLLARMQVPTLIAFAIVIGFIVFIFLFFGMLMDPKSTPFPVIVGGFWILALLTVPFQSANAIASERMNERLGAILTTPLTAREILDEWLAPVRRWIQFLVRPLIVLFVMEAIVKFKTQVPGARCLNAAIYLGVSFAMILVYPRLVQWTCLWIGLRMRNQIRAMMTALLLVAAWSFIPAALAGYLLETGVLSAHSSAVLKFISPVTVIRIAEAFGSPKSDVVPSLGLFMGFLVHFGLAAALCWKMRQICLSKADRYLGRI
ncbi:MAG TPA: hypothetical protein VH597_03115 [Verrucomicrobiae bacterium]|nr:hypothetical protein [Verrucomicrobiae bacterium]